MIKIKDNKDCCGCNACVQRCPKQCILMHEDSEGFLYPKVDENFCIDCGLCEKVCPVINQSHPREPFQVYAAKNPNEEIRKQSSSGGIFTMLAEKTIERGGVVFGVAFDKNWEVEHQYTETKEGLVAFRGSKYVQSHIGDTFKYAETFLKQGREVLFSGTPCQIAALKLFLCRDYENLIAVDFICHGVPSPGVFRTYLEEEKQNFALKCEKNSVLFQSNYNVRGRNTRDVSEVGIEAISFRNKSQGWKKFSFVLDLSKVSANGERNTVSLSYTLRENPFLRGFLANLYLRPSCHSCPVKELKSSSDITLGDYWGIASLIPGIDDDKGISAVLINTPKGEICVNALGCRQISTPYRHCILNNSAIIKSCIPSIKRSEFFASNEENFRIKVNRLCRKPFMETLKYNATYFSRAVLSRVGIWNIVKKIRKK